MIATPPRSPADERRRRRGPACLTGGVLLVVLLLAGCHAPAAPARWVTAWTTAPLPEVPGPDTPALAGATLRQKVRVTLAGRELRVRLANTFGAEPLRVAGARLGPVDGAPERSLRFGGQEEVLVPAGGEIASDPVDYAVAAGTTLEIRLHLAELPRMLTGHSAARSHSYANPGRVLDGPAPAPAQTFTRWYFLGGIDVRAANATAVAILGDSITDGYGIAPDSYARWPDVLARRLQADPRSARVAVLNAGIGGNRLLRDGLGPRALDRAERDVFRQPGVGTVVLFLGINDLGTRLDARKKGQPYASAGDIIGALRSLAGQARTRGFRAVGATITPYAGADFYFSADGEADRQAVNAWIRTAPEFDAVIDFDALLRDPRRPERLAPEFDSGDHLHPSPAGYAEMGRRVDLRALVPAMR